MNIIEGSTTSKSLLKSIRALGKSSKPKVASTNVSKTNTATSEKQSNFTQSEEDIDVGGKSMDSYSSSSFKE